MLFFFNRLTFDLKQQMLVEWLAVLVGLTYLAVFLTIAFACFPTQRNQRVVSGSGLKRTFSTLAEEYLQPNYSSPFAPDRLTNVAFNKYHNIYVYSVLTLWVAYGIAILFTLVSIGIGLHAMMLNNASFSNDFSTMVRTIRTAPMSVEVHKSETDGRQPLPKRLAKSRIFIGPGSSTVQLDLSTSEINKEKESTAEALLLSHGSVRTWPPLNHRTVSRGR